MKTGKQQAVELLRGASGNYVSASRSWSVSETNQCANQCDTEYSIDYVLEKFEDGAYDEYEISVEDCELSEALEIIESARLDGEGFAKYEYKKVILERPYRGCAAGGSCEWLIVPVGGW